MIHSEFARAAAKDAQKGFYFGAWLQHFLRAKKSPHHRIGSITKSLLSRFRADLTMMKAAAVLLLLPLAVTAFSPLAGRTVKSSTIARNAITSKMDWSFGDMDPEPEVRWFIQSKDASNRVAGLPRGTQKNLIFSVFPHSLIICLCPLYTLPYRLIPAVRIPMSSVPVIPCACPLLTQTTVKWM
jgi:hypothetical protein